MDIFQDNKRLEDLAIFGIEWGLYLRHNQEEKVTPYLYLVHGKKMTLQDLDSEGNPFDAAKALLADEKEAFDYILLGAEVSVKTKEGEIENAILIEAYDVASEFGVSLSKRFNPKENGGFEPMGNLTFMGKPELPIPVRAQTSTESREEVAVHSLTLDNGDGLQNFVGTFTGDDAFEVATAARNYLKDKLNDEVAYEYSGEFSVFFVPNEKISRPFLNFLAQYIQTDLIEGEDGLHWEESTGRKLNVVYSYDQEKIDVIKTEAPVPLGGEASGGGCAKSIAFFVTALFTIYWIW